MLKRLVVATAAAAAIAAGGFALAQTPHGAAAGQAAESDDGSVTMNMQGDDSDWWSNPYNYAFYGAAVMAFAKGADEVDAAALDAAFMQIARDFALHMGADPAMMQDHLKLISGQMIEIVREDPGVVASYENMMLALRGPS